MRPLIVGIDVGSVAVSLAVIGQDRQWIDSAYAFHRGDAARGRGVDGVGLGLSLAREIVRAHGGELGLQESRAGWTCFAVRLPRRRS